MAVDVSFGFSDFQISNFPNNTIITVFAMTALEDA
jgi:hypothetical protein